MRLFGKKSKVQEDVAIGKDGWLFLQGGRNDLARQLAGTYRLPLTFTWQWQRLFAYRRRGLAQLDAAYVSMIVPNKECVYASQLPADITVTENRPVARVLRAAARADITLLYPLDEFRASVARGKDTFATGDTHWNARGALIAYRQVMQYWGLPALGDEDLDIVHITMNDLARKLSPTPDSIAPYARPKHRTFRIVENNGISNRGNLLVAEQDNPALPTCLVFRDSHFSYQFELFAQSFRRLVASWQPNIDYGLVAREKPDFVLCQRAERFIVVVPDDKHGETQQQLAAQKTPKADPATLFPFFS